MLLIGYCLGNLLSPQMWKAEYAPRYYVPWGIILATYVLCPCILVISLPLEIMWQYIDYSTARYRLYSLAREQKKRPSFGNW
jgi:hypothetical protein